MTTTDVSDMTPSRFVAFATELGQDLESWADAECAISGRPRWENSGSPETHSFVPTQSVNSPAR